jgi:hypothetical protein
MNLYEKSSRFAILFLFLLVGVSAPKRERKDAMTATNVISVITVLGFAIYHAYLPSRQINYWVDGTNTRGDTLELTIPLSSASSSATVAIVSISLELHAPRTQQQKIKLGKSKPQVLPNLRDF